ncbi:MAG TPA: polymorphic toxin-type HINT domain-containing protein [Tepidisphaeraceae bacterium]|jgi:hypothetical protein|nr:polymorphic toxin-type HINT domain-containing protein [Tepidisphaeraceae bacterium]
MDAADVSRPVLKGAGFVGSFIPVTAPVAIPLMIALNGADAYAAGASGGQIAKGVAIEASITLATVGLAKGIGMLAARGSAAAAAEGRLAAEVAEGAVPRRFSLTDQILDNPTCFVAGMQVVTAMRSEVGRSQHAPLAAGDGGSVLATETVTAHYLTQDIESLRPGDRVLARDQYDSDAPPTLRRVEEVFTRTAYHLTMVVVRSSTGREQTLYSTNEHPVYVPGRGWVVCRELAAGDELLEPTGGVSTVTAVATERHPAGVTVYNLRLAESHTYFVREKVSTAEPVWVHNAGSAYRSLSVEDVQALQAGERIMPRGNGGTILDHIQNYDTKYISVSKESSVAALYDSGQGMAEIDLEIALETGSTIVPHEQLVQIARCYGTVNDLKNVINAKEFLIKGGIDPSAVIKVR